MGKLICILYVYMYVRMYTYTGFFSSLGLPLKVLSTEKLIWARLGVSRTIYVNVDSPNLGFPYFNFSGEALCKKHPVQVQIQIQIQIQGVF